MEKYSFFNSIAGDRKKFAEDFAEFFNSFIVNGIFAAGQNLLVSANDDLTVTIAAGKAWINGYFYYNTDSFIIDIPLPDAVLSRIDRIVIRLDMAERKIGLKLLKGVPSSTPTPPEIKRTGDYYDLCIADISVIKGAISITQANITDNRLINTLCGLVRCPVDRIPTETLMLQFEQHLKEKKALAETEINAMLELLHNLISGDTVGMLIEMIESHTNNADVHTTQQEKEAIANHISNTTTHITTLTHSKSSTIHTLTGIPTASGIYTAQFRATADYLQGDTFNGYTAKPMGEDIAMPNKAFVTGDLVTVVVDTQSKKLGFKVGGGGINDTLPSQVKNLTATADNAQVTLSWTNPTSSFTGLLIMRKAGSMPTGVKDGVKVYDGISTVHTDTTVTNGTTYYYRAFPYNMKKQYQTEIDGGVVSAKPVAEPTDYTYLTSFNASTNWTCPETGYYKVFCFGKSTNGGSYGTVSNFRGMPGGNAGGLAVYKTFIKEGSVIPITANATITSFGEYCSATSGTIETGGTATGGNITNATGGLGGSGGDSKNAWTGANGGNNGGRGGGGAYVVTKYSQTPRQNIGAGRHGASYLNAGNGYVSVIPFIMYGAGGGCVGSPNQNGGTGAPATVIIEKGVYA